MVFDSQNRLNYYLNNRSWYLKTYWENNDGGDLYLPNGFKTLPENIYRAFAEQIDKDGKVLDLGCGNGLMLKYLMLTSGYKLIPYGVDFLEPSIKQAKEILHPQYAANFTCGNVVDYSFKGGPFDFIFTTIHHIYPGDRKEYLNKLRKNCRKGGKIIFYEYEDVLKAENYTWVGEFSELKTWKLIRKDHPEIILGIFKKS